MTSHTIVILIDHKGRDLMGAALIAHHLERLGYVVHLEPLQSFKTSIPAWKPSLVIVNHIVHANMANYSAELHKRGILVACLLNEGLCLSDSNRKYMSERQYDNIHCDLFLTWNELHTQELIKYHFVSPPEHTITVGCPRFDFYQKPWDQAFLKQRKDSRINILLNTTFAIAHFYDRSEEEQHQLYKSMGDGQIRETVDYKSLIKAHHDGLHKLPEFLIPLIESAKYNIILRPHPREELSFYNDFIARLPTNQKALIRVDKKESIQSAILNADIVLNCEDCTTSVESWIANKPTITLTFEKNPVFFTKTYAERAPQIDAPDKLIAAIEHALNHPEQEEYKAVRDDYLHQWLYKMDGKRALSAAESIHRVITELDPQPDFPKDFTSMRRGLKLRLNHLFNEPSHSQFKHFIKKRLFGENCKQSIKYRDYLKAVRPNEASSAIEKIRKIKNAP